MKVPLSNVLKPESILQDVQSIMEKKGYSLNEFTCEEEQVKVEKIIKISRGDNQIQYREPNNSNPSIAFAITWLNDFMNDLRSGRFQ